MAPSETKRVVVLTADAGFGHRRAAEALVTALQELHGAECLVDLVNPLDDPLTPAFLRGSQAVHDQFARGLRRPYGWGWHLSRARALQPILGGTVAWALRPALRSTLCQHSPDVVVTTHPLYHPGLGRLLAARRVPLVTVVTDLGSVHPLWFSPAAAACLVPTQTIRDQAVACGLRPSRVLVTGVPVDPRLAGARLPAAVIREELGWRPDRPALLAVGGRRVLSLLQSLRAVDSSAVPLQLAIVAGGDDELYARLSRVDWKLPVRLYNWVNDLPRFMQAADCLLCKAGGLIVSEGLACGLPLLLVDRLPDQELGNAEFVVASGAGELALEPEAAAVVVRRWFGSDGRILALRAQNARAAGRPRAAYEAAEQIWQAAQQLP